MDLPASIQTYFTVEAPRDADAFRAAFAPDAIVHDEGHAHRGPDAIGAWWQAAKDRYHHTAEPLDIVEAGGKTVVRARVTGDFPGNPAILTFTFGLADGRIADLRIG